MIARRPLPHLVPALVVAGGLAFAVPPALAATQESEPSQAFVEKDYRGYFGTDFAAAWTDIEAQAAAVGVTPAVAAAIERRDIEAAMYLHSDEAARCVRENGDNLDLCYETRQLSRALRKLWSDSIQLREEADIAIAEAGTPPDATAESAAADPLELARALPARAKRLEESERLENIREAEGIRRDVVAAYEAADLSDLMERWERIEARFRLAENLRLQRRLDDAAEWLAKANSEYSEAAPSMGYHGELLLVEGRLDRDRRRFASAERKIALAVARFAEFGFDPFERPRLDAILDLALLQRDRGELDAAMETIAPLLEQAAMRIRFNGTEEIGNRILVEHARMRELQGLNAQAEQTYRDAVARMLSATGTGSKETARALVYLADNLEAQGHDPRVPDLYERALRILVAVVGRNHPDTAGASFGLARRHERDGQFDRAARLYAVALENLSEFPVGLDHAATLARYGATREALGEPGEADRLFERSFAAFETVLGDDPHILRSIALQQFGEIQAARGDRDAAIRLMQAARAGWMRIADPRNPERIVATNRFAQLQAQRPDTLNQAFALADESVDGAEQRLASFTEFDESAQRDLAQLSPVFLTKVRIAWRLADRGASTGGGS